MLLSIDPGINSTGLTVFSLDYDEQRRFKIHLTININNLRKFTDKEKEIEQKYNQRVVKVLYIIEKIKEIINNYSIEEIIIEGPFYSASTPVAFGSILEVINAIKYIIALPNNIRLTILEPLLVKKIFTKERLANKNLMKLFFLEKINNKEIIIDDSIDINSLTEHQIDSIAIGFCWSILKTEGVLTC